MKMVGLYAVLMGGILFAGQSLAQQAPVPVAIRNAKTVFLSNTGRIEFNVGGGSNRLYVGLYNALQAGGGLTAVSDPGTADLILEPYFKDLSLQLKIYDSRTHFLLWTLDQGVKVCNLQKTCDQNLDQAIANLAIQMKDLPAQTGVTLK
jgi:hypothetical protein